MFEELLDQSNSGAEVSADGAYRSADKERTLKDGGWRSRIHRKGQSDKPLTKREQQANHKPSRVRARVEHVFAQQEAMGAMAVRTIGIARARFKIGMKNLVYNMRRLAWSKENVKPRGRYAAV